MVSLKRRTSVSISRETLLMLQRATPKTSTYDELIRRLLKQYLARRGKPKTAKP